MRSIALSLWLGVSLAACAHARSETPPVCDGRHLRPANPYGSVLAPAAEQRPPASPAAATPRSPAPTAKTGAPTGGCA